MKTKEGVEKYYFNSRFGVDPARYVGHRLGNWYEIIKVTRSLPLKSIVENAQFTHTSVATEIAPTKLNQKDFDLPKGAKSEKSPYQDTAASKIVEAWQNVISVSSFNKRGTER